MQCSYYDLLEVPVTATYEDIRLAYKKAVLKCHPDKSSLQSGDGDRIYKLNEAFAVLKDPEKRAQYNSTLPSKTGDEARLVFDPALLAQYLAMGLVMVQRIRQLCTWTIQANTHAHPSSRAHTGTSTEGTSTKAPPPRAAPSVAKDINISINVSLEDIYKKRIKKLVVSKRIKGGTFVKKPLYISLCNYEKQYTFQGEGDENDEGFAGDIVVTLDIADHPLFSVDTVIDPYDLWMEVDVTLYEYYYGKNVTYTDLAGNTQSVDITQLRFPDMLHRVDHGGLPYLDETTDEEGAGHLYIKCRLQLPKMDDATLNDAEFRVVVRKFF